MKDSERRTAETPWEIFEVSLEAEAWREYDFQGRVYRIEEPQRLWLRKGGGTHHRVLDRKGIVHCIPEPGMYGCVLRWKNKEGYPPCEF